MKSQRRRLVDLRQSSEDVASVTSEDFDCGASAAGGNCLPEDILEHVAALEEAVSALRSRRRKAAAAVTASKHLSG